MKFKKSISLTVFVIMLLTLLTGCKPQIIDTVHMATKPMTEQYIMGYMMKTLIEQDTGLTVELTEGVGGGVANQLTFGAEYDFFEREDGYDALCETYGLDFADTMDLDIGLKYDAINQRKIDVMNIFTTDGQLSVSDVTVLEDDLGLYPSYVCGFVVRQDTLKEHPELQAVFDKVTGLITDAEMAEMNYLVEGEGKDPENVALAFLQGKGLVQ